LRGMRKAKGFTAAALVTLALGIGATTAIFSVVQAVLLTPLPYADADRRVMLWSRWVSFDKTWLSNAQIDDYQRLSTTMTAVGGWTTALQNLTGDGEPVRVGVGLVTANLFDVLGARPLHGRVLTADEDRPGAPPVVVLGHDLWQARYGGDPAVVGRTILINDVPAVVAGVMPPGFRLPTDFTEDAAEPTQLWRALQFDPSNLQRGNHGYYGAGVLAPGQTAATVSDELAAMARRLTDEGQYPEAMRFTAFAIPIEDEIRGDVRPAMWLLMGAVGFLLLIACANVAGLLLVRGDARVREIALRTALGAPPGRLVRQVLTESLVLSLIGAALGLAVAACALRVLMAIDPTSLPPLAPVGLDGTVAAFTLLMSVATALVFGVAPALRARRVNLVDGLKEGGANATTGAGRQRVRGALVVVEVALAVVLTVAAGLMVRSLTALGRVDLGFNPDGVLTLQLGLPSARYETPEQVVAFYRALTDRLRALPGVQHAGVVRALPLATTIGDYGLDIDGFEELPGQGAKGDWQIVSDDAFEAMGMRLVRGRWFGPADVTDGPLVAVVNETMAATYWKDGEAVGGRLRVGNAMRPWATVVGIVADERHNGVTGAVKEKFYVPHSQWHRASGNVIRNAYVVLRTDGDPLALAGPARSAIRELDASLPVTNIRPMRDVVATALATPRLTGVMLGSFAVIALALAAVGLYGVLAYLVGSRTREIGIRLAVGAGRGQVLRMVLGQGLWLAVGGLAAGVTAAAALTSLMRSLLYQVEPADPLTFAVVGVTILLVALVASGLPACRATRISPTLALRSE
ncbi:MAG: ABC transporter permease, partial [Vicinamibacteria bacterium]